MKDIAIYGAGGFGREIACLIKAINKDQSQWNIIGFFDDGLPLGQKNEYGAVLGGMAELNLYPSQLSVVMAIGNPKILASIVNKIDNPNIMYPNLIAPDALFFDIDNISIGKGNIIGFKTIISCNVKLGDFNLFNSDITIGHDSQIGSYNVFNPSTRISGAVKIGMNNLFGVGSVVLQQLTIGNQVTIGANSTVVRKTKDNTVYFGTPATVLI